METAQFSFFDFSESVATALGVTPGWKRGEDSLILEQPTLGVRCRWIYWKKGDKFFYDQMIRSERPGAIFLPIADGKVGLIKQFRPQARDQKLYEEQFPNFNLENLGRESWEAPRGFRIAGEKIEKTVQREAESETGGTLVSHQSLPSVCDNTAFSPHLTHISYGKIDLNAPAGFAPDGLEIILSKVVFYSLSELNDLEDAGVFYDAYTSSAIDRLRRRRPELLR